jgi:GNAT superfamily N-acetyltransferase
MEASHVAHALNLALSPFEVRVRTEQSTDIDFSAALYALTRAAELAQVPWPDEAKRAFCRQQFDAQHTHYVAHYAAPQFLIIERDGEQIGERIDARIGRVYVEQTAHEVCLMEITLLYEARNRGIGTAISAALVQYAHACSVAAGLHVESQNPARRLYERQGFREVEARGFYLYMRCEPSEL